MEFGLEKKRYFQIQFLNIKLNITFLRGNHKCKYCLFIIIYD